jgi:hypothetical protein
VSRKKDSSDWLRQIRRMAGVRVEQSRSGHWLVYLDNRLVTTVAGTGGRGRGLDNSQAAFRRAVRNRNQA